jgi:hypothetical protein
VFTYHTRLTCRHILQRRYGGALGVGKNNIQRGNSRWQWRTQEFFSGEGGSTNSIEDRGHRELGSGCVSPLVRGSTQFENESNPYSDKVVKDVFTTELGIRLSFVKTSEFLVRGGWTLKPPSVRHWSLVGVFLVIISSVLKFWDN